MAKLLCELSFHQVQLFRARMMSSETYHALDQMRAQMKVIDKASAPFRELADAQKRLAQALDPFAPLREALERQVAPLRAFRASVPQIQDAVGGLAKASLRAPQAGAR